MKTNLSILLITDVNYWKKEIGSHNRIFTLIDYLTNIFDITVFYINEYKNDDKEYFSNLNHKIINICEVEPSYLDTKEVLDNLTDNTILKQFYNEEVVFKTNTLIKNKSFSHVILEYIKLSYLLPLLKNQITILDTHDIMYKRNDSFKKNNQKHWIDISKKEEIKILSLYDKIICIQDSEHKILIQNELPSICSPHPMKVKKIVKKNSKTIDIVFIGGYSIANNFSIKWFIDNIWDYFENLNNVKLNVYGAVSESLLPIILKYNNIILHGKIDNLDNVYNNATIAINPVQMGGGLKIKNIEALSYNLPLITTNEGAKGMFSKSNDIYLLANSKEEWIDKLKLLISSSELRKELSYKANKFISKDFNHDKCFKELREFLNKSKSINEDF